MSGVVGLFQAFSGEMSVNLGGDEVRMAEEFLNTAQVGAGIQQVRGVTVPQFVRGQVRIEAGEGEIFFKPKLQYTR